MKHYGDSWRLRYLESRTSRLFVQRQIQAKNKENIKTSPHYWPFVKEISHSWWRHQMEAVSALLAICAGNSPVSGEFPTQRPVTQSFDVFFILRLNKQLSKQWWGWWFETPWGPLWHHCNVDTKRFLCHHVIMCSLKMPQSYDYCVARLSEIELATRTEMAYR